MKRSATFVWWEMWIESWTTAMRFAETMAAVPVVVNRQLPMIHAAARHPFAADYVELYTMVSGKVEAGMLSAMSLARDYQAIQAAWLQTSRSAAEAGTASMR